MNKQRSGCDATNGSEDTKRKGADDANKYDGSVESSEQLVACERRAIEIYYAAPPEKLAGECRAELIAEFGEACVSQMLANGIGNNGLANVEHTDED